MLLYWICLIISIINTCQSADLKSIFLNECDNSKTCFRHADCTLSKCNFFASWKVVTENKLSLIEIELMANLEESDKGYVAIGFSDDSKMGNDGVIGCYLFNSKVDSAIGYNPGYRNEILSASDALVKNVARYFVNYDSTSNILSCRIYRLLKPSANIDKLKDLNNKKYYVLGSVGTMRGLQSFGKHYASGKYVTDLSYDMKELNNIPKIGSRSSMPILVKLHAVFMVVGWMVLITNGILVAGVFRHNWPNSSNTIAVWFRLHQAFQLAGIICVVVGFIIIFSHTGWKYSPGLLPSVAGILDALHPIFGIISTILMLCNPINSLFRCKPNHPKRPVFNWSHFLIGVVSYVLAMINLIIGLQIPDTLKNIMYPWILSLVSFIFSIACYIFGKLWLKKNVVINVSVEQHNDSGKETVTRHFKPVPVYLLWISLFVTIALAVTLIIVISIY